MVRISLPIESLMQRKQCYSTLLDVDFLIVGSGYGGAIAAMRLASDEAGSIRNVVVLERGKEYALGDFPYDFEDMPSHVRLVRNNNGDGEGGGYPDALFNIYVGSKNTAPLTDEKDNSVTDVLVGSGLGGTSLINANVAEEPLAHVFRKPAWPKEFRTMPNPLAAEFEAVKAHIGVTTRTAVSRQQFPKYTALRRLGQGVGYEARAATITVTTATEGTATASNAVGVTQNPCTDCGNCVTGCNVGAKNSLDRNLLRLAKSRGASFYTGATVHTIEPIDEEGFRWKIHIRPTVQPKGTLDPETYCIRATNVILAAGTLGSTEILLRSQKEHGLGISRALGKKFSTNGDGIIMSYGQEEKVGAIARSAQKNPVVKVGPTITGIIRTPTLSIEEASIPAPMARVFSELVTTGAMLQRLSKRKLPALFKRTNHDPLAASMEVAEHCQALLIMGDDGANGTLSLSQEDGSLKIHVPNAHKNGALLAANKLLKEQDRSRGLDGGQYVPNPLWQLMPPEAGDVIGGLPDGRVVSVHPLGGCAMADNNADGVVDHAGRVFHPTDGIHDGLYVFDGSIVPAALEVNPFLTIAALAWRNSGLILQRAKAKESTVNRVSPAYADLGQVPDRHRDCPKPTAFTIQEQLTGKIEKLTPWLERKLSDDEQTRITQKDGLVIQVNASNSDAEKWLNNPGREPLDATMQLFTNPLTDEEVRDFHPVGVNRHHLQMSGEPFLVLHGAFTVLAEDDYDWSTDHWGGLQAVLTYYKRRGGFPSQFNIRGEATLLEKLRKLLEQLGRLPRAIQVFYNIGILQSRFRRIRYEFKDQASGLSIKGDKVTGYSDKIKRMWPELLNLELSIQDSHHRSTTACVKVNTEYLLEPGLVEVTESANLPQSLLFAGGLASFFARSLLTTNFWEFGGLERPKTDVKQPEKNVPQRTRPGELKTRFGNIKPEPFDFAVPLRQAPGTQPEIPLLLTRYKTDNAEPILLLHGLAQGSQIYWTDSCKNLASHLYEEGYDVWLLDYRLSTLVLPDLKDRNWSMDEIALFDIPMAIDKVYSETKQKVSIFGHCVGACTLAMAVLNDPALSCKIKAAVTNAIHPWVIASPGNRFRAKFGGFYRDWVSEDLLNPIPQSDDGAVQNVFDRLAFSLARIEEDKLDDHQTFGGSAFVHGICDRMSFLYGRMWNHKNLALETHEAFKDMLGPAPASVYQHLYYYTQLRRLTDKDGENTYLDRTRIQCNWRFPILFVHGDDSRVFNPHSARRSARRLDEILNPQGTSQKIAVDYKLFPGYGHMDVIFGKNAHKTCFPTYVDFLRNQTSIGNPAAPTDWAEPFEARPVIGPVLRAAWIENGHISLRLWSELRTNLTTPPTRLVTDGGNQQLQTEVMTPYNVPPSLPRFRFVDVEIVNTHSTIHLTLRGDIQGYQNMPGAKLMYDEQAWLWRLRANAANPPQQRMRFVVGSCRYPGSVVDNALSDKVYEAICAHSVDVDGAHLLFLIGDQIYADATDQLFEVKSLKSRYTDRYRLAFSRDSSPNFARLVSQVPTHFALDDHEIDDNWSALPPAHSQTRQQEYEYAADSAARFMSSGRNQAPILTSTTASPFYYALVNPQECDFPTFVADTRTERNFRNGNNPANYNLISDIQYEALKDWLLAAAKQYPNEPKFIFSGSIIAPLPATYCNEKSTWRHLDGWAGYPATLEKLLVLIAANNISKVIFVGGDAHISSVSELELHVGGNRTTVWQIVSSGLYAPMPFANAHVEDFAWDQSAKFPIHGAIPVLIKCTNTFLSDHYSQFLRVDANTDKVNITCFDETNEPLAKHEILL